MSGDVFAIVREEIQSVRNTINSNLLIKAGHVGSYAHVEFSPMDNFMRPALIISVARLNNCMSGRVISLGAIVQFIFMATQIHAGVPESTSKSIKDMDPRDGTQFPVLVGDYLYGKFFTTLCQYNMVNYLKPLAEIIAVIHEGGFLRRNNPNFKKDNKDMLQQIVKMETAELMAGSARLAGDLAGFSEKEKDLIFEYGLNLGMAYGLINESVENDLINPFLHRARELVSLLTNQQGNQLLENLIYLMEPKGAVSRQVVNI